MSDLQDLYQEVILDHGKAPRNFGALDQATNSAEGYNPLCGDKIHVHVAMDGDRVSDIRFEGTGCAISVASASLLTESVKGKSREEALAGFERFKDMVAGESDDPDFPEGMEKVAVFSGVREFPMRVKCATLAWHTLKAAMEGGTETAVTTE